MAFRVCGLSARQQTQDDKCTEANSPLLSFLPQWDSSFMVVVASLVNQILVKGM